MGWIILEGLDRTGKTTIAELYKKRGYDMVHMSAPDKKYQQAGYTGPSYLDEMLDIYMKYNARDVVFDRSPYGEFVWPLVYGRKALLTEDDIAVLQEIEANNGTERVLLYDSNVEAHWKRCVANKEPLDKNQFNNANYLFDRLTTKFGFRKHTLNDIRGGTLFVQSELTDKEKEELKNIVTVSGPDKQGAYKVDDPNEVLKRNHLELANDLTLKATQTPEQLKLEKANVINEVLSKKILKKSGGHYDVIENEIRQHLNGKLGDLLGSKQATTKDSLSAEEVKLLKAYCEVIKEKLNENQRQVKEKARR